MKPVDQTILDAQRGNCFAACVASVLELPLADVPNFMERHDTWFEDFYRWVAPRGYAPLFVQHDAVACGHVDPRPLIDCGHYFIVGGTSPRGPHLHSIVEHRGKMVHDPHPSRAGIIGVYIDFIVLVPNQLTDEFAKLRLERDGYKSVVEHAHATIDRSEIMSQRAVSHDGLVTRIKKLLAMSYAAGGAV